MSQNCEVMEAKKREACNLGYLKAERIYLEACKGFEVGFEDGPGLVVCAIGFSITLVRIKF